MMASQSSGVRVMTLPPPKLMPPLAAAPGMTMRLLAPMLAMVFWMTAEAPLPISIMAMTAATPMMMPSVVRPARMGLRRRARRAVFMVRRVFMSRTSLGGGAPSTISPSLMWMMRRACEATSGSCVTSSTVMPSSAFSCWNIWRTSRLVWESRLPVGSSARRRAGWLISDRAMATRCCWPPDSCDGSWSMRSARPTRPAVPRPAAASGGPRGASWL